MSLHSSNPVEPLLEGPAPWHFPPRESRPRTQSKEEVEQSVARLGPWVQGPFQLGDDVQIDGQVRSDLAWRTIAPELPSELSGARVLDVGCNAGFHSFMLAACGAGYVLGSEPSRFIDQALFLEAIYGSGVDFRAIPWQQLKPESHGSFDLVLCAGILHRELDPVGLLARLHEMTAPGGTLLLGGMMLADPTLAELIRFVPLGYDGDREWWWVPGPLALSSTIEATGFQVERRFGEVPGPAGEFDVTSGYLRASRTL